MWPISILNWSLFGQLPRGPFFTLFGWPKPWELSLIVLGRSVGGPNCGSFCLIGQNSGSYRLYKPKTMGAIAQNELPEAKTMGAITQNESPEAKTMGATAQNEAPEAIWTKLPWKWVSRSHLSFLSKNTKISRDFCASECGQFQY